MEEEEQGERVTTRSHGKRSKDKKKAPQRGLGVAQLERIRLQEHQNILSNHLSSSSSNIPFVSPWNFSQQLNHNHHQQAFPSMVNLFPIPCSQIEPPSNQIYHRNRANDQEKMVGNKRPFPFVDNQPGSTIESRFSEFLLNSCPNHRPSNLSKLALPLHASNPNSNISNEATSEDFLTLSLPPSSKLDCEIHAFETTSFQGDEKFEAELRPPYIIFPPTKKHSGQSTANETDVSNAGLDEKIDLNLKL